MFSKIRVAFDVVPKVISVVTMVVSVVEMIKEDVQESETSGEEKHKEAAEKIKEVLKDSIEEGYLPEWADIFMDTALINWLISAIVQILEWRGFFDKEEE